MGGHSPNAAAAPASVKRVSVAAGAPVWSGPGPNALGGKLNHPRRHLDRRGQPVAVRLPGCVFGREPEKAQDSQMIFGDALQRVADEPHPPRLDVVEPAEIIENFARAGIGIERVDGKIAAPGVGLSVVGKFNRGAAAVG